MLEGATEHIDPPVTDLKQVEIQAASTGDKGFVQFLHSLQTGVCAKGKSEWPGGCLLITFWVYL